MKAKEDPVLGMVLQNRGRFRTLYLILNIMENPFKPGHGYYDSSQGIYRNLKKRTKSLAQSAHSTKDFHLWALQKQNNCNRWLVIKLQQFSGNLKQTVTAPKPAPASRTKRSRTKPFRTKLQYQNNREIDRLNVIVIST